MDGKQAYKHFLKTWRKFQKICEKNHIKAKDNFSCCNNCGHGDMHRLIENDNYEAYVFYCSQGKDIMIDNYKPEDNVMETYLQWSYIDNPEQCDDNLGNKIKQLAALSGATAEYIDGKNAIKFTVNLPIKQENNNIEIII